MENTIYVKPEDLHSTMLRLRKEKQMDFLRSLTGMDWGTPDEKDTEDTLRGLGVVYHLESTTTGERMVVKTSTLDREHPELPTVWDIWKGANLPEREVYDFFGIVFVGHPDMRCATTGWVTRCARTMILPKTTRCAWTMKKPST